MGLLAKLKQMFSSNIVYNSENDAEIGVLYKNKATKLKKGSYIVIEDKSTAVIVFKNSIMDYLYGKGKFKVAPEDMPRLFEKAVNERNEEDNTIKVDLYFIKSTSVDKFIFGSSKPFLIKSRDYGRISGQVDGMCDVTITNVKDLFHWLFLIKRHFKSGKIDEIISETIGNAICKAIERSKIDIKDIVLKNANINEYLNIELENAFEDLGFGVKNIYLKGMQFNAKVQDKINAIIQREYEKIDKTQTKYITINTLVGGEEEKELVLPDENVGVICQNCGKELDPKFEFCPYCGNKNIH